jgi:serine/threonine protein kinase
MKFTAIASLLLSSSSATLPGHDAINWQAASRIKRAIDAVSADPTFTIDCRPKTVSVEDHLRVVSPDPKYMTDTAYLFQTGDTELIIKVTRPRSGLSSPKSPTGIHTEYVIQSELNNLSPESQLFTKIFEPKLEDLPDGACMSRVLISEYIGAGNFLDAAGPRTLTRRELALIGAKLIDGVEQIHRVGVVHGDLHFGNVLIPDKSDLVGSLRIIDFGEARMYVDPHSKTHIPFTNGRMANLVHFFNPLVGAPWEFTEDAPRARRDDFFRIAFMLLYIAGADMTAINEGSGGKLGIADIARLMCHLSHPGYPEYTEMLSEACEMGFTDVPDYHKWKQALRELAHSYSPEERVSDPAVTAVLRSARTGQLRAHSPDNPFAVKLDPQRASTSPLAGVKESDDGEDEASLVDKCLIDANDESKSVDQEITRAVPSPTGSCSMTRGSAPRSRAASPIEVDERELRRDVGDVLREKRKRYLDDASETLVERQEDCQVSKIRIRGHESVTDFIDPAKGMKAESSQGKVWVTKDGQFYVKIIFIHEITIDNIATEKAFFDSFKEFPEGKVFLDTYSTEAVDFDYDDENSHIRKHCTRRTIVTKAAGTKIRRSVRSLNPQVKELVAAIAEVSIQALQSLHNMGVIHGDINRGNIIIDSEQEARFIDFGRARVFTTPTGLEDPEYVKLPRCYNRDILSPFELEHFPETRRDDMYRLAETLYRFLKEGDMRNADECRSPKRFTEGALLAAFKRNYIVKGFPELVEFHHEMSELEFYDRPRYEYWIQRFRSVYDDGSGA